MTKQKDVVGMTREELDAYVTENAAADSLKNAQKPKAPLDAEVEALAHFMKLDDVQKQSFLSKALSADGNDVWKKGAGVGDGVAAKNAKKLHGKKAKKENPTV